MRVLVNGIRLFFDVDGQKLAPDGSSMREKPTLVLLHGGPGMDHSPFKVTFPQFADICQLVYVDLRANGRSDRGRRDSWTMAQWGDDVFEFCRALEIVKPIVLGQSFGGMVAMSYATRHPEHPGKLILSSTSAKVSPERQLPVFERLGGPAARDAARRFYLDGDASADAIGDWWRYCAPLITRRPPDPAVRRRKVLDAEVTAHVAAPDGELKRFNILPELAKIECPTLILGGEDDPFTPIEDQSDIAAAIPAAYVRFERFPGARHGVWNDDPSALEVIRDFIVA